MELAVAGEGVSVTEDVEQRTAEQVERLRPMFASEPDVRVTFRANGAGKVEADLAVGIRGYRTVKARGKGVDEDSSLESALKKLEWKYRLFWSRGSFRYSDCC